MLILLTGRSQYEGGLYGFIRDVPESIGGEVEMPMEDAFRGEYVESFTDKFGMEWMIDYSSGE